MTSGERQASAVFAAIRRDDPAGVIGQFSSLPSANQYRKLYELTERYVPSGAHVLDWGCGRGHFAYHLLKRGYRVTAFSLEHPPEIFAALSDAESSRLTFVHGELDQIPELPFSSGAFAAVFSVGVLEHVQELGGDEPSSLLELRRVLRDDGLLICYHLPNRYSLIEAASRGLRDRESAGAFHRHRFTAREIRTLCRGAGFSIVQTARYGFLPRNSLNRLPPRLRDSRLLTAAVNRSDALLERVFSPVVQNFYFVARPASAGRDA